MIRRSLMIGLVSFAWVDDHLGGLQTHVQGIANYLIQQGHQVFIHCVNTSRDGEPALRNTRLARRWHFRPRDELLLRRRKMLA